jgi:hypothetical protein
MMRSNFASGSALGLIGASVADGSFVNPSGSPESVAAGAGPVVFATVELASAVRGSGVVDSVAESVATDADGDSVAALLAILLAVGTLDATLATAGCRSTGSRKKGITAATPSTRIIPNITEPAISSQCWRCPPGRSIGAAGGEAVVFISAGGGGANDLLSLAVAGFGLAAAAGLGETLGALALGGAEPAALFAGGGPPTNRGFGAIGGGVAELGGVALGLAGAEADGILAAAGDCIFGGASDSSSSTASNAPLSNV